MCQCVCVCVCVCECVCVCVCVYAVVHVLYGRGKRVYIYMHIIIYVRVHESVMWFIVNVRISAGKALHFALADDSFLLSTCANRLKELHDFYMSLCVMKSRLCFVPPCLVDL